MRKPKKSKKAAAIDMRVEMLGDLNDRYKALIEMPISAVDIFAMRELAAEYREKGLPGTGERIAMEAFILERRKSVLNRSIIVPIGTNLANGGTDESIPASLDIPIAVSLDSDSLRADR